MKAGEKEFSDNIMAYVRKDFFKLRQDLSVDQALDQVRSGAPGDGILYLYVVDEHDRLVGVLPTRRLLTAPHGVTLQGLAVTSVVAITSRATVQDACEMFIKHKYLAFPVVDDDLKLAGLIDISLFTEEIADVTERSKADELFELLGFRASEPKKASPLQLWRHRFPWLLTTIASGTICAFLAAAFEKTLAHSIVLAFFLTLVLALGESVSIQSMSLTIQRLRFLHPSFKWYFDTLRHDLSTALLLALSCGIIVGLVVSVLHGFSMPSLVVGASVALSLLSAATLGLTVPTILHALKLDLKMAAGPLTLAIADAFTILIYLLIGAFVLQS